MNSKDTYMEQRNLLAQRNNGNRNPSRGGWRLWLKVHWKEWKYELGQLGVTLSVGPALRPTYKGSPLI